jgi:acyl-CoA reductase-like NAD-dependent aldehyde dehydrogenase
MRSSSRKKNADPSQTASRAGLRSSADRGDDTDDAAALEVKLATATQVFRDRKGWLQVHQRVDVLGRLAALIETRRDHFSRLIAQEGGKPLTDAIVETVAR